MIPNSSSPSIKRGISQLEPLQKPKENENKSIPSDQEESRNEVLPVRTSPKEPRSNKLESPSREVLPIINDNIKPNSPQENVSDNKNELKQKRQYKKDGKNNYKKNEHGFKTIDWNAPDEVVVEKEAPVVKNIIEETKDIKLYTSFDDMDISDNIFAGVCAYGFENPSLIQQKAIMPIISGKDIIAQAPSGTGKTGTFVIGTLQRVNPNIKGIQIIVMSPTRELAEQTSRVYKAIGEKSQINTLLCIGGTDVHVLRKELESNRYHVIVATPGRIIDMIEKKFLRQNNVKAIVLDEADQLLDRSFVDDMRKIIHTTSQVTVADLQIIIISATINESVLDLSKKFLRNPIKILVPKEKLTLAGIKQYYVICQSEEEKFDVLRDLYSKLSIQQTIIYANSINTVELLKKNLDAEGFPSAIIHAKRADRADTLSRFRHGNIRILLSTDVLTRGIDVQQVSMVINYDLPFDNAQYLHRIGRSGRFGRKGIAISFVLENEWKIIESIKSHYNTLIEALPPNFEKHLA